MSIRPGIRIALGLALAAGLAHAGEPPAPDLFRDLQPLTNDLARYDYLTRAMPRLSPADRLVALQLLAATEDELGRYNDAIRHFPLVPHIPPDLVVPQATAWRTADAVDTIAAMAVKRRIVMVNEAHHDAHTRQLTLALLPRLRALGFNYFAAEALGDKDAALMQRGYPVAASGSEYLREPLYGEIIRTAIRLGFTIVPYDADARDTAGREAGQARNLYQRVFAKNADARLFVHAGYAHIDKAKGRLGDVVPMAMQLQALTGHEPLSVDQTEFRDVLSDNPTDVYHQLVANFKPRQPVVLLDRRDNRAWSAEPKAYDLSVILPPVEDTSTDKPASTTAWLSFGLQGIPVQQTPAPLARPDWLSLGGQRTPYPIDTTLCARTLPCVVEAHYLGEPDDATAADRYLFQKNGSGESLYLFPGRYRLRAWGVDGKTLGQKTVELIQTGASPATTEPTASVQKTSNSRFFARHSRESGNPSFCSARSKWIPAFAGMTSSEVFRGALQAGGRSRPIFSGVSVGA